MDIKIKLMLLSLALLLMSGCKPDEPTAVQLNQDDWFTKVEKGTTYNGASTSGLHDMFTTNISNLSNNLEAVQSYYIYGGFYFGYLTSTYKRRQNGAETRQSLQVQFSNPIYGTGRYNLLVDLNLGNVAQTCLMEENVVEEKTVDSALVFHSEIVLNGRKYFNIYEVVNAISDTNLLGLTPIRIFYDKQLGLVGFQLKSGEQWRIDY